MSIFSLDNDVKSFLVRLTATLDNVDNVLAEYQMLAMEARKELAALKAIREKLQK